MANKTKQKTNQFCIISVVKPWFYVYQQIMQQLLFLKIYLFLAHNNGYNDVQNVIMGRSYRRKPSVCAEYFSFNY